MICDTLQHAAVYHNLSPRLATALKFLASAGTAKLDLGKHAVDGENIFALVQEYQTATPAEKFWETHRRYIDIQYIVSGAERMGFAPAEQMRTVEPYDATKDFTKLDGNGQFIEVHAGSFTIFFTHDAHMGGVSIAQPQLVRKIVMKVAV